ncbi:MAG: S41 family peptidase, partial [Betaproteobacteria bacterium]
GRVVNGRANVALVLEVRGPAGETRFELTRTEQPIPLQVTRRALNGNLGYIAFNRFRPEAAADVGRALTTLHATDALILDLRGNPGGSIGAMLAIAHSFFPETRHVLTRKARQAFAVADDADGSARSRTLAPEVRIPANMQAYTRPLVILIDGYTASSSELLATVLREQRGAYVVGRSSCGCVVAVRGAGYRLPGGGALYVAETGFVTPQGNRMEGAGMRPDRPVPLTLDDLREGVDRDLLEATQWLIQRTQKMAEDY